MTSDDILFQAFMAGVAAAQDPHSHWMRGEFNTWLSTVLGDNTTVRVTVSQTTVTEYGND